MDNVRPQDLPAFLDPLLDYLTEQLPEPLYDALFTVLSYGLVLSSRLISLTTSLVSLKPWQWDAQKILPPLITLLIAYYALLNMYRTTRFMLRLTFLAAKCGLFFAFLGAAISYFVQPSDYGRLVGSIQDVFGRQGERGSPTLSRGRARSTRSRPRMYDSFTAHQQWRYDEQQARMAEQANAASDAQRFIQSVAGLAGRAIGGVPFDVLSSAKNLFDGITNPTGGDTNSEGFKGQTQRRQQPNRKAKASSRRKTASR